MSISMSCAYSCEAETTCSLNAWGIRRTTMARLSISTLSQIFANGARLDEQHFSAPLGTHGRPQPPAFGFGFGIQLTGVLRSHY